MDDLFEKLPEDVNSIAIEKLKKLSAEYRHVEINPSIYFTLAEKIKIEQLEENMSEVFDNLPEDEIELQIIKFNEDEERYRKHAAEQVQGFVDKFKQMFDGIKE